MSEVRGNYQAIRSDQSFSSRADSFLAIRCEGNVARASMAAIEGPFGLAVTDDEDARCCHGGGEWCYSQEESGRREI